MKRIVQIILLCTLGMMLGVQGVFAQENTSETLNANNVLSVKGGYESFDGIDNFKHFEVEVLEAGNYYARFWLLPARYEEGQYTSFKVYVNGNFVGVIQPTQGNWQSASVNNVPALALSSGTNIISIATSSPEAPLVESIKLSKNAQAAEISAQAYDDYLAKATNTNGVLHEPMVTNTTMTLSDSLPFQIYTPLKYSFYSKHTFTEGEELTITSSSSVEHAIDLFFLGTPISLLSNSEDISLIENDYSDMESLSLVLSDKITEFYIPATPNEIQGLNWKRFSTRMLLLSPYLATLQIKIPLTGKYMIKLRPTTNQVLSVANIDIIKNGVNMASYDSIPIYYACKELSMPADSCNYAMITLCQNSEEDDPMLFIEGADGDRIVGYNDDRSSSQVGEHNLGRRDALITQAYRIKTTGVHVCNYSSSNPESQCLIIGGIFQNTDSVTSVTETSYVSAKAKSAPLSKSTAEVEDVELNNAISILPHVANLSTSLTISSREKISAVRVFNLSGVEVAVYPIDDYSASVALPDLNIHTTGIYLFQVECVDGSVDQQKILVQ